MNHEHIGANQKALLVALFLHEMLGYETTPLSLRFLATRRVENVFRHLSETLSRLVCRGLVKRDAKNRYTLTGSGRAVVLAVVSGIVGKQVESGSSNGSGVRPETG